MKEVIPAQGDAHREHYVRDAQGNVMAIYRAAPASLALTERPLYGSSRLGSLRKQEELYAAPSSSGPDPVQQLELRYELTDHLGNVSAVLTGRLLPGNGMGSAWQPEVVGAQGYEAFGSLLPGRNFASGEYRFGFNTQEKVDEMHGATGTHYSAEFWEYDPRVVMRWNMDPVVDPSASPYQINNSNPIFNSDPRGDCPTGDCNQYRTPTGHGVSVDKGASVWGNDAGDLMGFTTGGDSPLTYSWNGDKGGYFDGDGNQYSEGGYWDGFGRTFNPSAADAGKKFDQWKHKPVENTAEGIGKFFSDLFSESTITETKRYWTSSLYQMGLMDGGFVENFVEAAPIMAFTAGAAAYAAPALAVPSSALTDAQGFFIGPIVMRAPFNIPVQRGGAFNANLTQHWGLRIGTNETLNRVGLAMPIDPAFMIWTQAA